MRSFVTVAAVALSAAALGASCSGDWTDEAPGGPSVTQATRLDLARQRFPNVELRTHEGTTVRFYDDLIKGNIVAINFMYATCKER